MSKSNIIALVNMQNCFVYRVLYVIIYYFLGNQNFLLPINQFCQPDGLVRQNKTTYGTKLVIIIIIIPNITDMWLLN